MKTGIRLIAAGLAVACVGLIAGCGGSSDPSGSASAAATTGSDFVAQANAICAKATADFKALGDMQSFESVADFQKRFGTAMAIAKQQYADIEALTHPADIANDVDTYLQQGATSLANSQDLYDQVGAGKDIDAAVNATVGSTDGQAVIDERRAAAKAAGLTECMS